MLLLRPLFRRLEQRAGGLRGLSSLVLVEHDGKKVAPITLNALTAARKLGDGKVTCLLAGGEAFDDSIAQQVAGVDGVVKVLVAKNDKLNGLLPGEFLQVNTILPSKGKST